MRIRSERGAGGIGCLFLIALIAAAGYAAFMLAMPKFRNSSFEDRLNETLPYFAKGQPAEVIRKRVVETAKEFDIDLAPEDVRVDIRGDRVTLDISYDKVVDFKYWKKTLHFSSHRSGTY